RLELVGGQGPPDDEAGEGGRLAGEPGGHPIGLFGRHHRTHVLCPSYRAGRRPPSPRHRPPPRPPGPGSGRPPLGARPPSRARPPRRVGPVGAGRRASPPGLPSTRRRGQKACRRRSERYHVVVSAGGPPAMVAPSADAATTANRWAILLAVGVGAYMSALDNS